MGVGTVVLVLSIEAVGFHVTDVGKVSFEIWPVANAAVPLSCWRTTNAINGNTNDNYNDSDNNNIK